MKFNNFTLPVFELSDSDLVNTVGGANNPCSSFAHAMGILGSYGSSGLEKLFVYAYHYLAAKTACNEVVSER